MPHIFPNTLAGRFARIVWHLHGWAGLRLTQNPALRPVLLLAQTRLQRMAFRFSALVEKFTAGTLKPPRPRHRPAPASRPDPLHPDPAHAPPLAAKPPRVREYLPRHMSWLRGMLGWEAAYGSELQYLLKLPEMHALIRAAPQVGRLLRPLCRMLGVVPDPALLPPPPKRTPPDQAGSPESGRIGPDPAAPVPTEPAEKPMRRRPLRTEARKRKPKWTYPGTEWRKWGGFWFPEPIRKPA